MNTAVQLSPTPTASLRCEIIHGTPQSIVAGPLGPVALFSSDHVVAYMLRSRRRPRLCVFRTLSVDDPLAALVTGVRPRVQLLLSVHTAGRVRMVRSLFAQLAKSGHEPSRLTDGFFLRVSALLAGRLPPSQTLASLLSTPEETVPPRDVFYLQPP